MRRSTPKENQDFKEIHHLIELEDNAIKLLKTRGIDFSNTLESSYTFSYNSNFGEVTFTYLLKGKDKRAV